MWRVDNTVVNTDIIDSKANGMHVLPLAPVAAAVFLHQRNQEAAGSFIIFRVIILLQQRNLILGVDPERVCREADWKCGLLFFDKSCDFQVLIFKYQLNF